MNTPRIDIEGLHLGQYRVTVPGATTTRHEVGLADAYRLQLTGEAATAEELLRASFAFLLEREPNTSILSRFELPLIASYFPEYETTMQLQFGK